MKNWSTKRKLTFWTHLVYVLIPTGAALVAAVNFWTFVFGEWYFALPLIASLEGVAAIGFAFRLAKVDSPFVPARHFIPFFSVATLAYELGNWLMNKHDPVVGGLLTAFIVGVFGTLFIKSFGVLEHCIIDPVEAAKEKATAQAQALLVPLAEHEARATVMRQFTAQFRALEGGQFQPTVNASMALRELGIDPEAEMARILAEREAQRREDEQRHPFAPLGLSKQEQQDVWQAVWTAQLGAQADQLDRDIMATQAFVDAHTCDGRPLEDFCPDCYQRWEDAESGRGPAIGAPEPAQATREASDEDENDWKQDWDEDKMTPEEAQEELERRGWEGIGWEAMELLPDCDEKRAELERRRIGREKLQQSLLKLGQNIGLLPKTEDASAEATQEAAGIAEPVGGVDGMVGAAEPVLGASGGSSAVSTWECSGCEAEGSNGSKGVAKKWSAARNLGDALYCGDCRKSGKYGK